MSETEQIDGRESGSACGRPCGPKKCGVWSRKKMQCMREKYVFRADAITVIAAKATGCVVGEAAGVKGGGVSALDGIVPGVVRGCCRG